MQEILEGSVSISEDLKQVLDERMEKYRRGKSDLYTWEEVKDHIKTKK